MIPKCDEPLLGDMLSPEKVESWTVEHVCRWLKMKHLDSLLLPFVWHQMTGLALTNLHYNPNAAEHHLRKLFAPPPTSFAATSLPQPKKKEEEEKQIVRQLEIRDG